MLKPGKNDIRVNIKFEADELELLQDNTYQMAESFGLDRRIEKLTGKREVGFYMWDLDCLGDVVDGLKTDKKYNIEIVNKLYTKIKNAIKYIETYKSEHRR